MLSALLRGADCGELGRQHFDRRQRRRACGHEPREDGQERKARPACEMQEQVNLGARSAKVQAPALVSASQRAKRAVRRGSSMLWAERSTELEAGRSGTRATNF